MLVSADSSAPACSSRSSVDSFFVTSASAGDTADLLSDLAAGVSISADAMVNPCSATSIVSDGAGIVGVGSALFASVQSVSIPLEAKAEALQTPNRTAAVPPLNRAYFGATSRAVTTLSPILRLVL